MRYEIKKWNGNKKMMEDFGRGYTEEDLKLIIPKGYKPVVDEASGITGYERKGSRIIYFVEEY